MGMPTPTNQSNPTSSPQGKGMGARPTGNQPNGDFGDPNFASPMGGPNGQPQGKGLSQATNFAQPQQQMQQPNGGQNGQPQGKGGRVTYPGQGGQPQMGKPNTYSNTVGPWDNASIQPRQTQSGKGKGY
jgi:hypothetical protein